MRITPPPHILHHWAFKVAVVVSAFVSLPLLRSLSVGKLPSIKGMLMVWAQVTQLMLSFMPYSLPCYAAGLISIICWWRKPCLCTVIGLFIAIPFLCGIPGLYIVYSICLSL